MKYNIRKNWIDTFEFIKSKPVVLLPFVIIAFLESLALELTYFYSRFPLSKIAGPIIKKFFGEGYMHYPGNLILLPKIFYALQVTIYILFGVLLTGACVNIFNSLKENLPIRAKAVLKNALKHYVAFILYGVLMMALFLLLRKAEVTLFSKIVRFAGRYLPVPQEFYQFSISAILFLSNIILQVFFVLTVPILVLEHRAILKAIFRSIYLGARNFFTIFSLLFLPFLLYLPISLLKSFSTELISRTFPEITVYITAIGIVAAIYIDCFVIISVSQFLLHIKKSEPAKKLK